MLPTVTQRKVRSTNRFLSGVSVLTLSALIVKVIGLFYKIPLLRCLGTEGMGYFNTAYELYALFCVISTAGLPVAMSMLISRHEADGHHGAVKTIYRISLWSFVILGTVGSVILFGFSTPLSAALKNPDAAACLRWISPTVFLICLSSAQRGFFQGKGNMLPTAISQVIEALGKLVLGLLFAVTAIRRGCSVPQIAAAAVLGLTVGTGISVLYLTVLKWHTGRRDLLQAANEEATEGGKDILRQLMTTAVPVTLSAGMISLTKLVDVALILRRLQAVGYSVAEANSLYGCYSTLAVPVFNILPSLTTSVALSVVPALSAALQKRDQDRDEIHKIGLSALRLTLWIAIPAAFGLFVYAGDILSVLFSGQELAVAQATPWLQTLAMSVPAACLITVCGAMLQASGHARVPIVAMLVGVICKIACAYWLLGKADLGLMGAPVSSLICDGVIVLIELFCLGRYIPELLPSVAEGGGLFFLPTLLSAAAVGAVAFLFRRTDGGAWPLVEMASVALLYGLLIGLILWRRKSQEQNA